MVTYIEEFPQIKLHDPSITRFGETTMQIKILYLHLHTTDSHQPGKMVTYSEGLHL